MKVLERRMAGARVLEEFNTGRSVQRTSRAQATDLPKLFHLISIPLRQKQASRHPGATARRNQTENYSNRNCCRNKTLRLTS